MSTPPIHDHAAAPVRSRQHPLLLAAAAAVILFCLIATAAVMGWIPSGFTGKSGAGALSEADRMALSAKMQQQDNAAALVAPSPAPVQNLAAAPDPAYAPGPAYASDAPVRSVQAAPVRETMPVNETAPRVVQSAPRQEADRNWCGNCGNIESIREIRTRAQGSGLGAGAGAVLGGLLGNQVGSGHGRQLATVAGAVGGAVVGNQVEGNMKASHSYEVRVRLDSGKYRTFHFQNANGWRDGERVRIVDGRLRSMS